MKQIVRWGILGPGAISRKFAADLRQADGAALVAVGSRSMGRAKTFAADYDVPGVHDTYEALASDPGIDAIYIGTPHVFHEAHTLLCLEHGKHVLCEKPLAINATQARGMIETARARDRLLMEAMWTRFLPSVERVRKVAAGGAIGTPRKLSADFGFRAKFDRSSRLFDPHLGGGALLDLGVYPVSFASMLFGPPTEIRGVASIGETGVDEECSVALRHADEQTTTAVASFRRDTAREAMIHGTRGWIRIHDPWWASQGITVGSQDGQEEILSLPFRGKGYMHEAEAFMELIRSGQRDSPLMPLAESLSVMETMDTLRDRWGMKYPSE